MRDRLLELYRAGYSVKELSWEFGISKSQVKRIVKEGLRWT